jgi:dipeptidase D
MESIFKPDGLHENYFQQISQYPHGSYHEAPLSNYIVRFAQEHNLRYKQYPIGNVIIYKNASEGYEQHPPVMLQAHMDMVCEKVPGSSHCFETDPLDLYVEDGKIRARGTSLGADDGVGVAYMLAILADDSIAHPPLECVFTVQEEVGCIGASVLDKQNISARRMVGLDDVSGCTTYISAGGTQTLEICHTSPKAETHWPCYSLKVFGLQGGHSGTEIHLERGNAIKLAARILFQMQKAGGIQLAEMSCPGKVNVIPNHCDVIFASDMDAASISAITESTIKSIQQELKWSDPSVQACVECCQEHYQVFSLEDSRRMVDFLFMLPDGFRHQSLKVTGLTVASSNLGIIDTNEDTISAVFFVRGALDIHIDVIMDEILTMADYFDWQSHIGARAPGWDYQDYSPLRDALGEAYHAVTGKELGLLANHGGLECGFMSHMDENMDIVTIGPRIEKYHSSDEMLYRDSFDEIYKVLLKLLAEL